MTTQTVIQEARLPKFQEDFLANIFKSAQNLADDGTMPFAKQQLAGLSQGQQQAISNALSGVGAFQPFLQQGSAAVGQGIMGAQGASYTPTSYQGFMDPYTEDVIAATQADIARQGQMQQNQAQASAVGSGAFGGSRQAVLDAERDRGFQQVKSDTLSKLLAQGFGTALQAAQNAGRLSGGLGQAFGTLAGTTGDVGRLQQALGQADISQLSQLGALRQGQSQAELDAQRQNLLQKAQEPFTRLQLGQNLLQGMPSASIPSTFTQATTPSANPFLQGVGAYTTLSQIAPFGGGKST